MVELILLRHGKSDWEAGYDLDERRPLSARGRHAADAMGKVLTATGNAPDFILTSPAMRAHSTAEMAAAAGGWRATVHVIDELYGGGAASVLAAIRTVPAPSTRVMVVGHEPTWSGAVRILIGGGDIAMPTAAAAGLEVLVRSWEAIGPGTCRLRWLLPPRLFTDGDLRLPA
ncbi:MAG: histidine phosphatase family protein [Acidimicrobiia bacterium]|nr:histidine phosphatase family protein [Acidimicrobiia bacterium]